VTRTLWLVAESAQDKSGAKGEPFWRQWRFLIIVLLSPLVLCGGCVGLVAFDCGVVLDEREAVEPVPAGARVMKEDAYCDGSFETRCTYEVTATGMSVEQLVNAYRERGYSIERSADGPTYEATNWPGRGDGRFLIYASSSTPGAVEIFADRVQPCDI
jgi:hypothetical protein